MSSDVPKYSWRGSCSAEGLNSETGQSCPGEISLNVTLTYNKPNQTKTDWVDFLCPRPERSTGASSNLIVRLSVRPFVCPFVRNSVPLTNKVQYLKFGWWYSNQTWTVSSSMSSSHFTDITCPWGWDGVKKIGLRVFAIFWLCCCRWHPCFTNTCLVLISKTCTLGRIYFYAPGLKGPPEASSNRIVRLSVRPSVRPSVCPSVRNSVPLTNELQYLKFGWWYSNQTWTISSSMGS